MTDATKLAPRLVVGLAGPRLHPAEAAWLLAWRPAGVILFGRNCESPGQLAGLCRQVREHLPEGAEIVSDHEGGPISVLTPAVGRPPAPWTLGRLDDPDLTRRVHHETARRLREVGIDRVLAPCCDVLTEPRNPVIGARAFGDRADLVAAHVAAAVRGLREGGVASCLKHWPGHGGTAVDTHERDVAAGAGAHETPFAAGLAAGADAVMVGHLRPDGGQEPVTLDPAALGELRRRWGPAVKLVSDDVTMGGLREAMRRRGVAPPDGRDHGLVDPAALPLAWLAALVEAGLHRLLVRGIPWRALPAPDDRTGPPIPPRERLDVLAGSELAPGEAYREARRRAAPAAPFADPEAAVLWLDCTRGDSWGDAGRLGARFAGGFDAVARLEPHEALPGGEPRSRLLITSHRPLPDGSLRRLQPALRPAGQALVMGHPSLAAAVSGALGPGWRVEAVYDLHVHELDAMAPKNPPGAD